MLTYIYKNNLNSTQLYLFVSLILSSNRFKIFIYLLHAQIIKRQISFVCSIIEALTHVCMLKGERLIRLNSGLEILLTQKQIPKMNGNVLHYTIFKYLNFVKMTKLLLRKIRYKACLLISFSICIYFSREFFGVNLFVVMILI